MLVTVTHFWDTRPEYAAFWPENRMLYRHNMEILHRDLPSGWEVRHRVMINWRSPCPTLMEFVEEELPEKYDVQAYYWPKAIGNKGHDHLVAMNKVIAKSYEAFSEDVEAADLVFMLVQDWVIANHYDANFLEVLYTLMGGRGAHPRNEALGWYDRWGLDHYDWVSHTIRGDYHPPKYRHNGALLFRRHKLSAMQTAVRQVQSAYECQLGYNQKERCLYLKRDGKLYFFITHRDRSCQEILEQLQDPDRVLELHLK